MDGETEWPCCFAGVLSPEESIDVPLQDGGSEVGSCGKGTDLRYGGRGAVDGLELVGGVTGDGVRTVLLSFKATVKLIQVVGQA